MQFSEGFVKITPGCGCDSFTVPQDQYERWKEIDDDGEGPLWYCPYCRECRDYTEKLERSLERKRDRVAARREEKNAE